MHRVVNLIFDNKTIIIENEIDGEAFLLLSDEELRDIVKLYGPRAKLIKKKREFINANMCHITCKKSVASCNVLCSYHNVQRSWSLIGYCLSKCYFQTL